MTDALVTVESLTKSFHTASGSVKAVDSISFAISPGESLGVVGESGSGKSTTARMIAGLETPTSGDILFRGAPVRPARGLASRRAQARRAQMVFQDPFGSLDPRQRLGNCLKEVIAVNGAPAGLSRTEYVAQLLGRVGLEERHSHSYPRALSGGQRQRFAIARALAPSPELVILDEAVSALDVSVQAQILNLLVELRQQSDVSYLFVSHDLAVVRQVCDRVIVMRHGEIVEEGDVESVLTSPSHPYTQRLVASVPGRGWRPPERRRVG
ncbi:ATP-binding cassette domain-containing protein [Microbacterium sp. LWH3-1.2]|uniref:ATP-binding cassette domain-containing protein n=1 Tax=Microbacterium sp. LWH3-1.2 TaxID=3135256 RepID=UPI003441A335